jgi:heptosyltransferase-3
MICNKHLKFLRKFLGNIARPRFGWRNQLTKFAKFFYLLIEWPFELAGDIIFFWKRTGESGIKDPHRILIVKVDQLGDVLFSTFLLPIIKRRYPGVEIDYLVNPKAKQVLEGNPHVANIYFSENIFLRFLPGRGDSAAGLWRVMERNRETMRALRARRYDAVINARAFAPSSNISLYRVGAALISFDISEQSFLADYWANYDLDEEEWENYLNLLVPLGINIASADFREEFYGHGAPNPMAGVRTSIGGYVVISPVSFEIDREWGRNNWRRLISLLVSRGMDVTLTGIPSQKKYLEELASAGGGRVRIFTEMSLAGFGALMKGAKLFIGIESFPAHLALASGKHAMILTNSVTYYLKGHSPKKFAIDARSMLPVLKGVEFFDVKSATAQDLEKAIGMLVA